MKTYQPQKKDQFTFGLWTVGNRGRDPFGEPVRPALSPIHILKRLSELGAYGVTLHDNDLVPIDATPRAREKIVKDFKKALQDYALKVPMATTNLFSHPIFKDGAFTSNDPKVRQYALQKTMQGMDLGVELGARIYVFWGGREGTEVEASKNPQEAIKWYRECLNFLCEYALDQKYELKFALEAKPNEPRGDIYLSTTGSMLGFIETLDHPEMVGVNPELGHEQIAGLNFTHVVAQALEANKLFHIDLNGQKGIRFDQDLRFGSEDLKGAFFLVKLLEDSHWPGPRHFDAHPYRTEDEQGVWSFAAGCMRTYLILKEKVQRFNQDSEIQAHLKEISEIKQGHTGPAPFTREKAKQIKKMSFDRDDYAKKGLNYERLDQLVIELLLGVR